MQLAEPDFIGPDLYRPGKAATILQVGFFSGSRQYMQSAQRLSFGPVPGKNAYAPNWFFLKGICTART
ncbi:hypothetical protein AUP45_01720 [Thalassospira xiamenensis]|nr:hypothetical protein AUP45_01720 [Thalassospira xiamenensis]